MILNKHWQLYHYDVSNTPMTTICWYYSTWFSIQIYYDDDTKQWKTIVAQICILSFKHTASSTIAMTSTYMWTYMQSKLAKSTSWYTWPWSQIKNKYLKTYFSIYSADRSMLVSLSQKIGFIEFPTLCIYEYFLKII